MKKGFTLIELLAVIVILAIIALIATPIVLSIINESKESAQLRSAEMYLKGVETSVASAIIHEKNVKDGTHPITPTGDICLGTLQGTGKTATCNGEVLEVQMNGEKPSSGTVTIASGKIKDIELKYSNDKTIVKNAGKLVYQKTFKDICKYVSGTEKTAGALYSCEVKPGTSYNFYVLTTPVDGDTTINLIMDRNICEDGTPATTKNTCYIAYDSSGYNTNGPVTAMTYLNNATNSWENIDNLSLTYDDEGENFTGFALNGKARLPYRSEVGVNDGTKNYLYENLDGSMWMGFGDKPKQIISGIEGYWLLSSFTGKTDVVCYMGYVGLFGTGAPNKDKTGVRPVITLKI